MAYLISNGTSSPYASDHKHLLTLLKGFAEVHGWTTLRWVNDTEMEWIARAPGLSGYDDIYIGAATYTALGIYNWKVAVFTGFSEPTAFDSQPGAVIKATPFSDTAMSYTFLVNTQRVTGVAGFSGYNQSFYMGKFFAYDSPVNYPSNLCVGGMLATPSATPYSAVSTNYKAPFNGGVVLNVQTPEGVWINPECWPINNPSNGTHVRVSGADPYPDSSHPFLSSITDTAGEYPIIPIILVDAAQVRLLGEVDGVYWTTGFRQVSNNIVSINGVLFSLMRDRNLTGPANFFALRLE